MVTKLPSKFESAESFKEEGNENFKNLQFSKAIVCYSKAINEVEPQENLSEISSDEVPESVRDMKECANLHVYYSNRALCNIKVENLGSAISDATKAISIRPNFVKAYYRRGCAFLLLTKYGPACKDFALALKLCPGDSDTKQKLTECKKLLKEQKFAEAIASDLPWGGVEFKEVDVAAIEVPESYSGPKYERETFDQEKLDEIVKHFEDRKIIHRKFVYEIVNDAMETFKSVPNVIEIEVENCLTVCGDIHGQFYDLLNIFKLNGKISPSNPYLFNGDFIDRGSYSVEVILTLLLYRILYPSSLFMSRGNHETANLNKLYGFEGELKAKVDSTVHGYFCKLFCHLPLAHLINGKIFVVHGGLVGKYNVTIDDINKIDRVREPPEEGLMTDMLWADPSDSKGIGESKRGVSSTFGPDVTENFLSTNKLKMVIRSHEMQEEGFKMEQNGNLITLFSAPNYCDQMGNKGALIRISKEKLSGYKTQLRVEDLFLSLFQFSHVNHGGKMAMAYANPMLLNGLAPK